MKKVLKLSVLTSIIVLIAISCQKTLSDENSSETVSGKEFDAAFVKEWYYGVFKKTAEWNSSPLHGKKIPSWKNGVYRKMGDMEIVEFPLIKARAVISVSSGSSLSNSDRKRIADASLIRIAFIKTADNKIIVRELDYIPDWEYLKIKGYNINDSTTGKPDNKFTGRMIVKKWNGQILSLNKVVDGKVTSKGFIKSRTSASPNTASTEECAYVEICEYERTCTQTCYGDNCTEEECSEWTPTGDCWVEQFCDGQDPCENMSPEECACMVFNSCGGGEEEDPGCNMTQEQAQTKLSSISGSTTTGIGPEDGTESSPDANGKITKPRACEGIGLNLNLGLGYVVHYASKYLGVVYKTTSNSVWKWEEFNFDKIMHDGGVFMPCMSATTTSSIAVAIAGNQLSASATGSYSVTATCLCLFGVESAAPYVVTVSEVFNSN